MEALSDDEGERVATASRRRVDSDYIPSVPSPSHHHSDFSVSPPRNLVFQEPSGAGIARGRSERFGDMEMAGLDDVLLGLVLVMRYRGGRSGTMSLWRKLKMRKRVGIAAMLERYLIRNRGFQVQSISYVSDIPLLSFFINLFAFSVFLMAENGPTLSITSSKLPRRMLKAEKARPAMCIINVSMEIVRS